MDQNNLDRMAVSGQLSTHHSPVWTPVRRTGALGLALRRLEEHMVEIVRVRRQVRKINTTGGAAVVVGGATPKQVISVVATESPSTQVDRTFSQVSVSFTRDGSDKNFSGVHVWFTGYKGNSRPVLMADGSDSPVVFLCETTKEKVTVTVQPFGPDHHAAPFAGAKNTALSLDGVVSAPPAPSIAQQTTTTTAGASTSGQQFQFNFLPATLSDVVLGYWIYRTGSHVAPTPPTSRWKFVLHNPNQQGIYTAQDVSGVSTNFYWVSAVNKAGLESSLSDAGGGGTTIYRPSSFTTVVGSFSNPAYVWDGNSTTAAVASTNTGGSVTESWQGWPAAGGSPTLVQLKITSQVAFGSGSAGAVSLFYSTDNGTNYTAVYAATASRAKTTDTITLSNAVNTSQVRVKMGVTDSSGAITTYLHEAWIEVTV